MNSLIISLDETDLAELLFTYSLDWVNELDFLDTVSKSRGMKFNKKLVADKVKELIGDVNE